MKKLLLMLSVTLLLASCITTSPRPYDAIEYNHSVVLTVNATRAVHRCSDVTPDKKEFWIYMQQVNTESFILEEFITNKADSSQIEPAVNEVRELVNQVLTRPSFSKTYCTLKLTNIQAGSRILSRVLGQSDEFKACKGGIKKRYDLFTEAYNNKNITPDEYKELVSDVISLGKIDIVGCNAVMRKEMQEDLQLVEKLLPSIMAL